MSRSTRLTVSLSALCALLASACGPGLVDPATHEGPPLVVLEADVEGALEGGVPPGAVRGALVWSAYDDALLDCLAAVPPFDVPLDPYANPEDELIAHELSLCLTLHQTSTIESDSVPLEPTFPASFDIPLVALPDPALLTGPASSRLGIASVAVYVDGNENGALDLVAPGTLVADDTVIGSSAAVHEDDLVHALVVFREGDVSPLWKLFRALYDCPAEPPQGYSILTVTVAEDFSTWSCTLTDGPIGVRLSDSDAMRSEVCLPNPELGEFVEATEDASIPGGAAIACEDGVAYFSTAPDAACPLIGHYDLYGCRDTSSESACRATFFDHTADPPSWWPCDVGNLVYFFGADETATAGLDLLGTIAVRGTAMFTLDDVVVEVDTEDGASAIGASGLTLVDNDGNGWANAGDTIEVRETANLHDETSEPGWYGVRVFVYGELLAESGYAPVEIPNTQLPLHTLEVIDAPGGGPEGGAAPDGTLLFSVRSAAGEGSYALEDLSMVVYLFGKAPERMPLDMITLVDADGDSRFGAGDTLEVRMTASVSEWARGQLHDQNHNYVMLEARTGVNIYASITGGAYAETTWGRFTFRLARLDAPFTDALDDVTRVHVLNATPFSLAALTGWWNVSGAGGEPLVQQELDASWFAHDDVDADGLVSPGDVLTLREAEERIGADTPVADAYHSLYLSAPDGSTANAWEMLRPAM